MSEKMDFADGKYTVINDNGKLTALRHGEPWGRDLVGDNLVYWMLVDSLRLKEQRDALLSALNAMLLHMGMDEDEWNKPTFDQARAAIAKAEEA